MGGKALAAVGGIFALAGCLVLTWVNNGGYPFYVYALPALLNVAEFFTDAALKMSTINGLFGTTLPSWFSYILGVGIILVAVSGVLSLIGIKVRALAIIGGLFALIPSLFILLSTFLDVEFIDKAASFISILFMSGDAFPGVDVLPYNYAFDGRGEAIGTYVLLLGGLLSFISGCISREDY